MLYDYKSGLKIEYFGESHSDYISVRADGIEKGIKIDAEKLSEFLERRKGGKLGGTKRVESDEPIFVSGVTGGKTDGNILEIKTANKNVDKSSYQKNKYIPRPSTADLPATLKYGEKYSTGGGKFSARMTAVTCALGYVLLCALKSKGVNISANIFSVGKIKNNSVNTLSGEFSKNKNFNKRVEREVKKAERKGDTLGGIIECVCTGLKTGVGDADFDGLESLISNAVFSVPSVKGVEFGSGFNGATLRGSKNNDQIYYDGENIKTYTNNAGGISGGMANGMPIVFRVAFKPVPSIRKPQRSVNLLNNENCEISIEGRHDVCAVIRATPIIESVTAIAVYSAIKRENALKNVEDIRREIDKIDDGIANLIKDRQSLVKLIAKEKKKTEKAIEDCNREKEILNRLAQKYPEVKDYTEKIYPEIFNLSKAEQKDESETNR